jgi:hypothetical protein
MSNRSNKPIVYIFLFVLFPTYISVAAGLRPIDRIYDFGEVAIDFQIFHEFLLVNRSSEPIHLDSIKVNCDCSRVWTADSTVSPGDTARIGLEFDTRDYYGRTSKVIKVYTDDPGISKHELFYLSTVGQWYMGLRPNPVSLFFLPGRDSIELTILNPALNETEVTGVDLFNDVLTARIVRKKASKGEKLVLEISPKKGLAKGTYHTSFRIAIKVPGGDEPIYKTIPAKIVRY